LTTVRRSGVGRTPLSHPLQATSMVIQSKGKIIEDIKAKNKKYYIKNKLKKNRIFQKWPYESRPNIRD
jgi:hypothetical protein